MFCPPHVLGILQFCCIVFLIAIFSGQINWHVSLNNNFSTCKWPIWWCQWINSFHPSYFNPSEKGRALTRQLTCPSVRLFLHCTKCINYPKIMHSQSTLVIYFFGVIQRKQQVLLDFFCKTRLPSKCWPFESNFVIKVGVWLGIFFIFSKQLYISILEDLTVIC